jgi:hypothetical protein
VAIKAGHHETHERHEKREKPIVVLGVRTQRIAYVLSRGFMNGGGRLAVSLGRSTVSGCPALREVPAEE